MYESERERKAVERWRPGQRWYHPALASLVILASRFIMTRLNRLEIEGGERFDALMRRGVRGLLTFSNHVSLFDDPLLPCNLGLPRYRDVRWVGADAINFFGSPAKAWLFTAGKAVPLVRGAGVDQRGFHFLRDRLLDGDWVHMFPEGGRTRDPEGKMLPLLRPGIGHLMAEARPIALPFYHYGMHRVLPVGARLPRRGNTIRVVFGGAIDCEQEVEKGATPRTMTALAREALAELEAATHPSSTLSGV
jgi:monolysocardiolipin acyltransferase